MLIPVRSLEAYRSIQLAERLAQRARRRGRPLRSPDRIPVTMLLYCPRMQYHRAREPRMTMNGMLLAEMGSAAHRVIEDAARELGAETEKPVEHRCGEVVVTGRADIVFPDTVVEVKTVPDVPPDSDYMEEHGLQAWFYAALLGRERAELLYVSRSTGDLYPVPAPGSADAVRRICDRARLLRLALQQGEEPGCVPGPWCSWCPYRYGCPCLP